MHKSLTIGIPAITLATIVLSAQVSIGQTVPMPIDNAATSTKPHCVVLPEKPVECFATEAEAMRVGASENSNRTPDRTANSVNSAALTSYGWRATLYEHANYNNNSLRDGLRYYIFGSCGAKGNISLAFNDKTTSLKVSSGCGVILYGDTNFRGTQVYFGPGNTPNVGAGFNDKASSYSFPYRL